MSAIIKERNESKIIMPAENLICSPHGHLILHSILSSFRRHLLVAKIN